MGGLRPWARALCAAAFLIPSVSLAADEPDPLPTIPVTPTEKDEPLPRSTDEARKELEPIVVTPGKRDQLLGRTAASVAAITGAKLEAIGARDSEDFLKLVPGLSLNKENADRSDPSIRGIASETRFQTTQRTTGIYIDEIPMTDPFIPISQPDVSPFDLERVEVLQGPQGTLFGSAALAGAIRYITQKPQPGEWHGKLTGAFSRVAQGEGQPYGAGMINVPLGDSAALRGVYVRRDDPGYIDDARTGEEDVGAIRQRHWRAQGAWRATDALEITATWLSQDSEQDDSPYADQRERLEHSNANAPSPQRSAFDVGNLVASYDFGWGQVLSSTSRTSKDAFLQLEISRVLGAQQAGVPVFTTADTQSEGFTQELRLLSPEDDGPWSWLVGGWYLRVAQDYEQRVPNPALSGGLLPGVPALPGLSALPFPLLGALPVGTDNLELGVATVNSRGTELAVFGDVTRRLGAHFEITAGGRLYRTDLRTRSVSKGVLTTASSGSFETTNEDDLREQGFNPRTSIAWRFDDDAMIYALASRGFRFGGVQLVAPPPTDTTTTNTFKSDRLWNYEIGARTSWLGKRVQVDATLFYDDWKDLQITRLDQTGLVTVVQNVGAAHSQGVQLRVEALPFEGLTVSSAAAYIDARTDEPLQTTNGTVPPHTRLPGTPHFQIASEVAWEQRFGPVAAGIRAIHAHVGPSPNNLFASEQLGGYDTIDLRAHLALPALPLRPDFSVGVRNLTDARGVAGAFADPASDAKDFYFITPRTLTATLALSF